MSVTRSLINEARTIMEAPGKFYMFEWVSGYKDEDDNRYNHDGHMIVVEVQSTGPAAKREAVAFYKANFRKVLKSGKRMNVNENKPTHEDGPNSKADTRLKVSNKGKVANWYPNKNSHPRIGYFEDVEPGVLSY